MTVLTAIYFLSALPKVGDREEVESYSVETYWHNQIIDSSQDGVIQNELNHRASGLAFL